MMSNTAILPAGVSKEALLTELRRLSWGAADILRASPWFSESLEC